MFTKFIPHNIQEKLKAKERALGWSEVNSSEPSKPAGSNISTLRPKDIMSRTVFLRMCSNKVDSVNNVLISGGERDENGQIRFGTDMYTSRQLSNDTRLKPRAGIKDVRVEYKGGYKALRECTVNWIVNSLGDLEFLTPYFLTVGKTVVVDFGWVNSNTKRFENTPFITFKDGNYVVDQSIFRNPQLKILESKGDYDAIGGVVKNFSYNLRNDGGFDCTTVISSLGVNLFNIPIDKGHNLAESVVVKGETGKPNSDSVFVPPENLINTIINLRDILYHNVFFAGTGGSYISDGVLNETDVKGMGLGYTATFSGGGVNTAADFGLSRKTLEYYSFLGKDGFRLAESKIKGKVQNVANIFPNGKNGLPNSVERELYKSNQAFGNIGVFLDSKDYPNVMVQLHRTAPKLEFFVTMGWFEDNILSRYTSYIGGDDREVKMTFRSIETVLHTKESNDKKVGEPVEKSEYESFVNALGSVDFKVLKTRILKQFGIVLDSIVSTENLSDTLKRPSLIRNPPLLKSHNPDRFFIKETLPTLEQMNYEKEPYKTRDSSRQAGKKIYPEKYKEAKTRSLMYEAIRTSNVREFDQGDNRGALRNIWINVKEIQKAFGISKPEAQFQDEGNVRPPGKLENGVKNLLSQMNQTFGSPWNFEITADMHDTTNVKVVDKKTSNVTNPTYTQHEENSHKVSDLGIYRFPSFRIGSIVKNQTLEFKIPDAMAVTAMYANNKTKGTSSSPQLNSSNISKLFRSDDDVSFEDKYLRDVEKAYQSLYTEKGQKISAPSLPLAATIGSENASFLSKILKTKSSSGVSSLGFNPNITQWWRRWVSGNREQATVVDKDGKPVEKKEEPTEIVIVKYDEDTKKETLVWVTEKEAGSGKFLASDRKKGKNGFYEVDSENGEITLLPAAKHSIRSHLHNSTARKGFATDDLIPATLGLTIDGTGGLLPGDIVQTDYIQPKYNASINFEGRSLGPQVYFQVTNVTQEIAADKWDTVLISLMRYNSIPDELVFSLDKESPSPADTLAPTPEVDTTPIEEPGVLGPDSAYSGFQLDNEFTLPPLETWKPKPDLEDIPAGKPPKDELPVEEPKQEEEEVEVDTSTLYESQKTGDAEPNLPPDPLPKVLEEQKTDPPPPVEIIKVTKTSPGQPALVVKKEVGVVEPPETGNQEVEFKDAGQVTEATIPPPKPKPKPKPTTKPKPKPPKRQGQRIKSTPNLVMLEQLNKKRKEQTKPKPTFSTYRGTSAQNTILYQIIPNWRTKLASTNKQREDGDYKQKVIYGWGTDTIPEGKVPFKVRKAFWDSNIEPRNTSKISNPDVVNRARDFLVSTGKYFSSVYLKQYDLRDYK